MSEVSECRTNVGLVSESSVGMSDRGSAFDKIPPEGRLRVVEVGEINVWQLVQEGQLPAKERQAECACESLELRHVHDVALVPRDHLETTEGHGRSRQ